MFTKVFAALRQEGVTKAEIANEVSIRSQEINQLVLRRTLTALSGAAASMGLLPGNAHNFVSSNDGID